MGKFGLKQAQGPAWPNRGRTNPVSASGDLRELRNEQELRGCVWDGSGGVLGPSLF